MDSWPSWWLRQNCALIASCDHCRPARVHALKLLVGRRLNSLEIDPSSNSTRLEVLAWLGVRDRDGNPTGFAKSHIRLMRGPAHSENLGQHIAWAASIRTAGIVKCERGSRKKIRKRIRLVRHRDPEFVANLHKCERSGMSIGSALQTMMLDPTVFWMRRGTAAKLLAIADARGAVTSLLDLFFFRRPARSNCGKPRCQSSMARIIPLSRA